MWERSDLSDGVMGRLGVFVVWCFVYRASLEGHRLEISDSGALLSTYNHCRRMQRTKDTYLSKQEYA